MGDDLEDYNAVLQILLEDFSLEEVALAAVKLVHIASGATEDEREIPDASTPREQRPDRQRTDSKGRTFDKGARDTRGTGPVAKIYIGMGRKHGMRPGDVVGAVANETGLAGTQIGPIQIAEFFTTVGIPEASVDHALEKLRNATFKGKKTTVRRFVEGGR